MRVLFIGGTGNISAACSRLALERGIELHVLNRGNRDLGEYGMDAAGSIVCNINDEADAARALEGQTFDSVVNFIAFTPEDIERDIRLFAGKTGQYIFISSASVYQKPLAQPFVTESTPLCNPFWDYSRKKIASEERLNREYRDNGFPGVIVRPSLTYDTVIPLAIGSWDDYTMADRMKKGKPVIVHGDGTSLWTITHSRDFARGLVGLLGHQQAFGNAFHITSDEVLTWDQIYQAVADAVGVEANIVHIASDFIVQVAKEMGQDWMEGNLHGDKAISAIFDNSKIKRFVPDFMATTSFKQGIAETLRWFEAKPERMKIVDGNNAFIDKVLAAYGEIAG